MRRAYAFGLFISLCVTTLFCLFLQADGSVARFGETGRDLRQLASELKLTDLCICTDARYARHPSQADLFSAFQDYPGSIEHFPSGSVVPPPDFSALGTFVKVRGPIHSGHIGPN